MNILPRRPREKDRREITFDARPPEAQAVDEMLERLKAAPLRDDYDEPESEVMPPETATAYTTAPDTRPPSATEANRLDDIALLTCSLTYGEMMDLAAALWQMRPEGKEITEQELPGMWHRWSGKEDSKI
jgi:hypothetical protein